MSNDLANLLREIASSTPQTNHPNGPYFDDVAKPQPFDSKVEQARAKKISNDNRESDQQMKKQSLKALFILLTAETVAIFILTFLQGFGGGEGGWFHLEEWCFRVLISTSLAQIAYMLTIAIKHLFPTK